MKEFINLVLCDYRSKRVDVHVSATLADGTLRISGQDLGPYVEDYWGRSTEKMIRKQPCFMRSAENTDAANSGVYARERKSSTAFSLMPRRILVAGYCLRTETLKYEFYPYAR